MSWSELQRLVETGEADAELRRALSHCRSRGELVLACRRLGFGIEERDLRLARRLDGLQNPVPTAGRRRDAPVAEPPRFDRCG